MSGPKYVLFELAAGQDPKKHLPEYSEDDDSQVIFAIQESPDGFLFYMWIGEPFDPEVYETIEQARAAFRESRDNSERTSREPKGTNVGTETSPLYELKKGQDRLEYLPLSVRDYVWVIEERKDGFWLFQWQGDGECAVCEKPFATLEAARSQFWSFAVDEAADAADAALDVADMKKRTEAKR
jgi:hypothetical protein